jgi:hypothetical protein
MKAMQEREVRELKKKLEEEERQKAEQEKFFREKFKKLEMQRSVQLQMANKIKMVKEIEQKISKDKNSTVLEKTSSDLKKGKLKSGDILGPEEPRVHIKQPIQQFPPGEKKGIDSETWKTTLDLMQYNIIKSQEEVEQEVNDQVDLVPTRERGPRSESKKRRKKNCCTDTVQKRELFQAHEHNRNTINEGVYELELRDMEQREYERQKELDRLIKEHKRMMAGEREPNAEYERIESKLQNIKSNLEPILKSLNKKKKPTRVY